MRSEKKVFSLLGGVFLMSAGALLLLSAAATLFRVIRYSSGAGTLVSINTDILLILCGLFLLLRRSLPAAILMSAAAASFTVGVFGVSGNVGVMSVCAFAAFSLFAAGLYGRGVYALAMCGSAALLRLIPVLGQLRTLTEIVKFGGVVVFTTLCSLTAGLLTVAAMVMAGLYLFGKGGKAAKQPEYPY